jgi:hypothetical protein
MDQQMINTHSPSQETQREQFVQPLWLATRLLRHPAWIPVANPDKAVDLAY